MQLLDAIDKTQLWKALQANLPSYQILPDTNEVRRTKQYLLASLYTVAKSAQIIPKSEEDIDVVEQLNVLLENIWDTLDVPTLQFEAGSRAALTNLGLTQVGWGMNQVTGEEGIVLKNVDPMRFMREPESKSLDTASWCCTWDRFDKTVFMEDSRYKDSFPEAARQVAAAYDYRGYPKIDDRISTTTSDTYTLIIFWQREIFKGKVIFSEYHTLNGKAMLYYKRDIRPARFPFAELYCNLPEGSLIGTSEPAVILANSIAYNLFNSMSLTLEYKRFNPPKFVSQGSNLNIASFSKHGNDPDRAWVVAGDARQAVHYHDFPTLSPAATSLMSLLKYDMQETTGVDARYSGRDTGSILTTGGTEQMLNRVTLIDAPKIVNYEKYCRNLTELILLNLLEFSPTQTYLIKTPGDFGGNQWVKLEVPFSDLFADKREALQTLFGYSIDISSELPKNKQRTAALANMVMEAQRQYSSAGETVDLITPEEWLSMQDFPHKEMWLKRMGRQRQLDVLLETSQIVAQYTELVNQGIDPEAALMQTAAGASERQYGTAENIVPGVYNDTTVVPNTQPMMQGGAIPMQGGAMPMQGGAMPMQGGIY